MLERGRASVPGSDQGLTVCLRERRAPPSEKARQRRAFFWVVLPASLLTSSGDTDTPVKQQARRDHHVSVRCSSSKYGCLLAKLHDDDSGLIPGEASFGGFPRHGRASV